LDNLFSLTYPHDQKSLWVFLKVISFDEIQFTKAKPAKAESEIGKHTFSNRISIFTLLNRAGNLVYNSNAALSWQKAVTFAPSISSGRRLGALA